MVNLGGIEKKKYDELCSIFLSMVKDEITKKKMERHTLQWRI